MSIRDLALTRAGTAVAAPDVDVALQMDEDAFRGFYDRTSRMLWTYILRLTGDRQAADDLLQDAYYRFLRSDTVFESEAHRRHYLFRIATNLSRDRFRRRRAEPVFLSQDDIDIPCGRSADAPGAIQKRMDLSAAMAGLKHRERAMLWLAYAQGASHKEIAATVGVAAGSVKPLLFRARRRLAALLGRTEGSR